MLELSAGGSCGTVGRFREDFRKSLHRSAAGEIPRLDCDSISSTLCKSIELLVDGLEGSPVANGQTNASIPKINTSFPVDLNWNESKLVLNS